MRAAYEARLEDVVQETVAAGPPVPLRLVSFACERDLPEHVASIRSFLVNVGVPTSYEIVSDGSHSRRSSDLLRALHPCVTLADWTEVAAAGLPQALREYADASWRGRKLLVFASLEIAGPTLLADADVLFFPPARELRALGDEGPPRYLPDAGDGLYLDVELLEGDERRVEGVNAGFVFLPRALDWSSSLRRLELRLRSGRATFTGQTVVHLALQEARARPFDPSRYVLAVDDRELPQDRHVGPDTVLRHYVTPVRHKLWTTLARAAVAG